MIEQHNKLFAENKAPFDMRINQFADLTDEEFLGGYASGLSVPSRLSSKTQ